MFIFSMWKPDSFYDAQNVDADISLPASVFLNADLFRKQYSLLILNQFIMLVSKWIKNVLVENSDSVEIVEKRFAM